MVCRKCSKCQEEKPLDMFRKDSSRALGHSYLCKSCLSTKDSKRYYSDLEGQRRRGRESYKFSSDKYRKMRVKRYWSNPNKERTVCAVWRSKNRDKMMLRNKIRQNTLTKATPSWLNFIHEAQIKEAYDVALAKSVQTGVTHHVDHIFPLKGSNFSGLHVPWNLQVIPASLNLSKNNKFPTEFRELAWSVE